MRDARNPLPGLGSRATALLPAGRALPGQQPDVDGDGTADLVITATGDHTAFTGFVL